MSSILRLKIHVLEINRRPANAATVMVDGLEASPTRMPGEFAAEGVRAGSTVRVTVEAGGFESETRDVKIADGNLDVMFILGPAGALFYRRNGGRVPFDPPRGAIGVTLKRVGGEGPAARPQAGILEEVIRRSEQKRPNLLVMREPADRAAPIVRELRQNPEVVAAGPVAYETGEGLSYFTGRIVVQLEPGAESEAATLAERHGLTLEKTLTLPGFVTMLDPDPELEHLLSVAEVLFQSEGVRSAEPELAYSLEYDAVTPTDELVDEQWHLRVSRLPDAWQHLRDANPPGTVPGSAADLTFGSADVIVAVVDSGVQSLTDGGGNVTAAHREFQGTVTNGQPKVVTFFNFADMEPNNDHPDGDHGIQCAGVAVATVLNASPIAGEEEGVAGAAPNCPLIAIQAPVGGPETVFSDMYLWATGRPHASVDPDWPANLARGADVVTNSHGGLNPAVFPVSALMTATFEDITDNALGGIGSVLCFSAGNADTEFAVQRPWANHPRTLGIAASNQNEVKASYSNFGDGIDLCAPSSDAAEGLLEITTTALPGLGNLAGHTGGPLDYTDGFGGTSSATPFTAGIAALLRSMDPTLPWTMVRDVLQATAVKIDLGNTDPEGEWRDTDSDGVPDYSNWYGFGRVDAAEAVCAARTLIELLTPTVSFIDVPEDETTLRAVSFRVRSPHNITIRVTNGPNTNSGPAGSFVLHAGDRATHTGRFDCVPTTQRIWIRYAATVDGATAAGDIEVTCDETGEVWMIPITANVIERPKAALVLSMDRSGSMGDPAGDGRLKIELLRDSAAVVPALAFEETGLGAVSWATDADVAGATPVADAGSELFGAGRIALQAHVSNHSTDPSGLTAIGDGVLAAQTLLDAADPDFDVRAMVVLTDGQETESLYLSELPTDTIHGQVFAIGLGTAQNIQPSALATLTGEREGYLLMTGNMVADDYFLLAKYYQQILAGVSNQEIIVDPSGWLQPGVPVKVPFSVLETDWQVDAVLHTPFPPIVNYWLEAPDGSQLNPGVIAAEPESRFVVDRVLAYYRLSLPIAAIGPQDPAQSWHAVFELDQRRWAALVEKLKAKKDQGRPGDPGPNTGITSEEKRMVAHGLRYSFVAQARSVLKMAVSLEQTSLEPGAQVRLGAIVTEYGVPLPRGSMVIAEITPPTGSVQQHTLAEGGDGEFAATFTASQPGVYRVRYLGSGRTTRGSDWTREALRSALTWRGGNNPPPGPRGTDKLCELLRCLRHSGGIDPDAMKHFGIDLDALVKCLCKKG